jgi:hypothetical protein
MHNSIVYEYISTNKTANSGKTYDSQALKSHPFTPRKPYRMRGSSAPSRSIISRPFASFADAGLHVHQLASTCTRLHQLAAKKLFFRPRMQHPLQTPKSLHRVALCCSVLHRVAHKIFSRAGATLALGPRNHRKVYGRLRKPTEGYGSLRKVKKVQHCHAPTETVETDQTVLVTHGNR